MPGRSVYFHRSQVMAAFAALDGVARLFPLCKGVNGQATLGGHDGLRLCLGVNAVCDCLIDDDLVVSHGENLQNIFY